MGAASAANARAVVTVALATRACGGQQTRTRSRPPSPSQSLQDDFAAHDELVKIIFGYKYVKWPNGALCAGTPQRTTACVRPVAAPRARARARSSGSGGSSDEAASALALTAPRAAASHARPSPPLIPPPPRRSAAGHLVDRKAFSLAGWCRLCAMLLSDIDFTLEDGMMHEGIGSA